VKGWLARVIVGKKTNGGANGLGVWGLGGPLGGGVVSKWRKNPRTAEGGGKKKLKQRGKGRGGKKKDR